MKKVDFVLVALAIAFVLGGCAATKNMEPVAIPQDPQEKLIWSSAPERPGWIYNEPENANGTMFFVGLSNKYATEKLAREDARRNATESVVKYMGTLVKNKFERVSTDFGLAEDVINPTVSAREFENQLAVNMVSRIKVKEWYMEKWKAPTGVGHQAFLLIQVPQASVEDAYKETAKEMVRKAEQKVKETNDEVAKSQAVKAVDFWKQMQEQGIIE
jgi:hypothetical protein